MVVYGRGSWYPINYDNIVRDSIKLFIYHELCYKIMIGKVTFDTQNRSSHYNMKYFGLIIINIKHHSFIQQSRFHKHFFK